MDVHLGHLYLAHNKAEKTHNLELNKDIGLQSQNFEQGHLEAYTLTCYNNLTFDSERLQPLY